VLTVRPAARRAAHRRKRRFVIEFDPVARRGRVTRRIFCASVPMLFGMTGRGDVPLAEIAPGVGRPAPSRADLPVDAAHRDYVQPRGRAGTRIIRIST
jgi:hypothetical protein